MKVVSPIADLDVFIGSMRRSGNDLVIRSSEDSTIETQVTISASDILATLGALLRSPSALVYVLLFPFFLIRGWLGSESDEIARNGPGPDPINKPW